MLEKDTMISLRVSVEQADILNRLAELTNSNLSETVRAMLWPPELMALYGQCCDFELVDIRTVIVGAVGSYLRESYMQNVDLHLQRLGLRKGVNSTAPEIEKAKADALAELKADVSHPLDLQIQRAEKDAVYLGRLIEAYRRARELVPGYQIVEVDLAFGKRLRKVWAVLVGGKIL